MKYFNSCVALVTPFDENGINFKVFKELIEFQIANGTDAILVLGTTGEASTMTQKEKIEVIKFAKEKINGRATLIVGTGSNDTNTALKNSLLAQSLGADFLLIVTPYYNKCTQSGLLAHYEHIAKNVSIPIIAYNVPARTSVNILPETVLKLAKIKNIVGIKEASGNMTQVAKILAIVPKNFAVYSGDDMLNFPMLCMGAQGVISVTANILPKQIYSLVEYCKNNDIQRAKLLHNNLVQINNYLFLEVNPIPIKYALTLLGFPVGNPRLPLQKISNKTAIILTKTLTKTTKNFRLKS